jgi:hypothetical protein
MRYACRKAETPMNATCFDNSWSRRTYWFGLLALLVWMKGGHDLDCDEGVVLEGAWSLINGQEPYTDSFQFIPPASFYVVYWLWKLLGIGYASAKALAILAIFLTAAAIFRTSLLVAKANPFTHLAPLLYCLASTFWPAINHNTFSACLLAWAVYFCSRGISGNSWRDLLTGGLLTGLSGLFLLHKAFVFALAIMVPGLLAARRRNLSPKPILLYLFAAAAPLAALALRWPPELLYEQLIAFPATRYWQTNVTSPIPLILTGSYVFLIALALRQHMTIRIGLLLIVQLAFLGSALQRTDWSHTLILAFPAFALMPAAYEATKRRGAVAVRFAYGGAAVLAGAFLFTVAVVVTPWSRPFHDATVDIRPLLEYIDGHCTSLYAGPWIPGLYFETRRTRPIRYPWLITGLHNERQFLDAREQLEATPPQCAVIEYETVRKFGYDQDNPVDRFFRTRYAVGFSFGSFTVCTLRAS